jgi:hypothetical protein
MTPAIKKGNALEQAVHSIESAILQSAPGLSENVFRFESKKIIKQASVHHEIDVFVTVDVAPGYTSIFIFECKNWEKPVGKNEIIVFSEKIEACGAQKGFFVAKAYTKDAAAQAETDTRIKLLFADELDPATTPVPFDFHVVLLENTHSEFEIFQRSIEAKERGRKQLTLSSSTATLHGLSANIEQYVKQWVDEACNSDAGTFPSAHLPEGTYPREIVVTRQYAPGEFILSTEGIIDAEIERAVLRTAYSIRIVRPPIVSHFEVHSRGRSCSFAPVTTADGAEVQFGFVFQTLS